MRLLVTGGAGFIGSHVVDAYVAAGHDVVVVDTLRTGRADYVHPRARLYQVDVASPELADVFARERPEVVNHHAALASVSLSVRQPLEDARVNVLGTLNVLDQAARSGVRRVIYASTGGALYGEPETIPVREDHPVRPLSPYGASKYAGEVYVRLYHRLHGLPYFILRYSNVFGPRQDPLGEAGVVAIFAAAMLRGQTPVIFGDGTQTRDFVYVEDVVRANLLATTSQDCGVVHIATGVETTVKDVHRLLAAAIGYWAAPQHGPPREGDVYRIALDVTLAGRTLGWRPQVVLEEGLRRTVEWFRSRGLQE
ncbi:MAG: NAD-dependent epimerase/dehydratase family protein [Armatimonadota bacterium]|nr:NAD-dependent epimerase/dehydratase family protein [Armatimonadota bacterium]MDR7469064.1 NAD-dependent epimerase/dehydratase family protein [Armatimonadota bacterium]MDR7474266.1 NAD-dependent epimerase/dehydratase family protein [Armatimonadota bacterium]